MKLKHVKKLKEAKDTKSFFFEPEKKVDWLPGQFYYYTLPTLHQDDSRGPTRHFTISSSPTEGGLLSFTTRIRDKSGYKQTLDGLNEGEIIEGEGPNGTFIFDEHEKEKSHVFLAGGIGITAFRVFLKYAFDKNFKNPLQLIYANSTPEEITFREELKDWSKNKNNFRLLITVSKPEESKEKWSGNVGRIDEELIKKTLTQWNLGLSDPTFWIVGPPPFTNAMEDILEKLKTPSNHILTEKFTGY